MADLGAVCTYYCIANIGNSIISSHGEIPGERRSSVGSLVDGEVGTVRGQSQPMVRHNPAWPGGIGGMRSSSKAKPGGKASMVRAGSGAWARGARVMGAAAGVWLRPSPDPAWTAARRQPLRCISSSGNVRP